MVSGAIIAYLARRLENSGRRISGLNGALRAAQLDNKLMEMIVSNANDGLLVQDEHAIIEWSNPAYSRITGFSAEELHGRSPFEYVVPPETRPSPEYIANFTYDFESGVLDRFEIVRNIRKNGEYFWNQLSFAVVDYGDGSPRKVIVIARDVTEQIEREEALERAKADLQHRAETDALTGLSNRLKLGTFLEEALREAKTTTGEVGLLHIDLDQFKEANDVFGHAAGDAVLVHTANILRAECGEADLACRVGGDEFIIVRRGAHSMSELEALGRRILTRIKSPLDWENERILLGASIGIAMSDSRVRNEHRKV
nr:diguanylate cyclase [uncultured Sphaerochaeta sp.]